MDEKKYKVYRSDLPQLLGANRTVPSRTTIAKYIKKYQAVLIPLGYIPYQRRIPRPVVNAIYYIFWGECYYDDIPAPDLSAVDDK